MSDAAIIRRLASLKYKLDEHENTGTDAADRPADTVAPDQPLNRLGGGVENELLPFTSDIS